MMLEHSSIDGDTDDYVGQFNASWENAVSACGQLQLALTALRLLGQRLKGRRVLVAGRLQDLTGRIDRGYEAGSRQAEVVVGAVNVGLNLNGMPYIALKGFTAEGGIVSANLSPGDGTVSRLPENQPAGSN